MKNILSIVGAALLLAAGCVKQTDNLKLPRGWRLPNLNEANDPWRAADPKKYITVKADFDGDGAPDEALILVREKDGLPALFVFLKKDGGFPKNLDGVDAGGPPPNNATVRNGGIKVLTPSGDGAPPAIEYFVTGGGHIRYSWDKAAQAFATLPAE